MRNSEVEGKNFVEQNQNEVSEQNPNPEKSEQPKESIEDVARKLGDARLALEDAQKQLKGPESMIGKLLHKLKGEQSRIDAQAKVDSLTSQIANLEAQGAELEKINGIVGDIFEDYSSAKFEKSGVDQIDYNTIRNELDAQSKNLAEQLRNNPDALVEVVSRLEQEIPKDGLVDDDIKKLLVGVRAEDSLYDEGKFTNNTKEDSQNNILLHYARVSIDSGTGEKIKTINSSYLTDHDVAEEINNLAYGLDRNFNNWNNQLHPKDFQFFDAPKDRVDFCVESAEAKLNIVSTLVDKLNEFAKSKDLFGKARALDTVVSAQLPDGLDRKNAKNYFPGGLYDKKYPGLVKPECFDSMSEMDNLANGIIKLNQKADELKHFIEKRGRKY